MFIFVLKAFYNHTQNVCKLGILPSGSISYRRGPLRHRNMCTTAGNGAGG